MNMPDHSLPQNPLWPQDAETARRARQWLLLGVIALGIAGIFAGLLANTKSSYFYTALVVHVDLSVLVWFLTIACMLLTLTAADKGSSLLAAAAFYSFVSGTLLIALSAFTGGDAYMSNYIPVIYHPVFFLGLGLLFCGVLGAVANLFLALSHKRPENTEEYGIYCGAIMVLYAAGCFIMSKFNLALASHGQLYYETLFWDGGHVLQFVHVQCMLVCWQCLARAAELHLPLRSRTIEIFLLFGLICVSYWVLYIYYRLPDFSGEAHRSAFTLMMRSVNGVAPLILGGCIVFSFFTSPFKNEAALPRIMLLMSFLLFTAGGLIGYLIVGSNVTVPAHYHGSIVGITIAFMGLAYQLLPAFGWADVSRSKLAFWQPIIYGGGQLCWMAGMAILGSHDVARKTPGSADTVGAFAAFLKHGGDGLALIGGLLFVFVVLRSVYKGYIRV